MENCVVASQNIKQDYHVVQRFRFWSLPPTTERRNSDIYIPMFTAAGVTGTKRGKQPKCPLMDEWIIWYIPIMEFYLA